MDNPTSVTRRVHVSESGRVLTSDEAALLRKYLLEQKGEASDGKGEAPFLGIGMLSGRASS